MLTIKKRDGGLTFNVYVQPRASQIAMAGCHDNALKIKLTAPPVGGAANKQCIQTLAKALDLPKSAVTITGGQTARRKQISVKPIQGDFTAEEIKALKSRLDLLARGNASKSPL